MPSVSCPFSVGLIPITEAVCDNHTSNVFANLSPGGIWDIKTLLVLKSVQFKLDKFKNVNFLITYLDSGRVGLTCDFEAWSSLRYIDL